MQATIALLLEPRLNDKPLATATGFVIQKGDRFYLVTNWHVVTLKNPATQKPVLPSGETPNKVAIVHNVAGKLGMWKPVVENLYDDKGSPRWMEHPRHKTKPNQIIDVVVLPLANLDGVATYPLDLELRKRDVDHSPGSDVEVIGFPFGLTAGGAFAIWKSGRIASEVSIDYEGEKVFLIDATTRPSMSGSPVFARRFGSSLRSDGSVGFFTGGAQDRFLGVYSGRIRDDSEIGVVWKADLLMEIFETLP